MEKENWINEIIDSSSQIVKVLPDESLFLRIQKEMDLQKSVSKEWLWLVAASILILLFLNFRVIDKTKYSHDTNESLEIFVSSSNQLYTE